MVSLDIINTLDVFVWLMFQCCCNDVTVFRCWIIRYNLCLAITAVEVVVMLTTSNLTSGDQSAVSILSTTNLVLYVLWSLIYLLTAFFLTTYHCQSRSYFTGREKNTFYVSEFMMVVLEGFTCGFCTSFALQEGKSLQDYSSSADGYRSVIFILSIVFGVLDLVFLIKNLLLRKTMQTILEKKISELHNSNHWSQ